MRKNADPQRSAYLGFAAFAGNSCQRGFLLTSFHIYIRIIVKG